MRAFVRLCVRACVSTGADKKANTRARVRGPGGLLEGLQRDVALEALGESGSPLPGQVDRLLRFKAAHARFDGRAVGRVQVARAAAVARPQL